MAEKSETFVTTRYIAYYTTHDLFFSFLSLSRSFRVLIYSIPVLLVYIHSLRDVVLSFCLADRKSVV